MNLKNLLVLSFLSIILIEGQLLNLINTPIHQCVRCLCHAVSGCYMLQNCARYSINYKYWNRAGSPRVDIDDGFNTKAFDICMNDDNCIINTISSYVNASGPMDCNCDNEYNCEDMLAIHFNKCNDPMSIPKWNERKALFRQCSGLMMDDPTPNCIPVPV